VAGLHQIHQLGKMSSDLKGSLIMLIDEGDSRLPMAPGSALARHNGAHDPVLRIGAERLW
jgi:hypothetical protein